MGTYSISPGTQKNLHWRWLCFPSFQLLERKRELQSRAVYIVPARLSRGQLLPNLGSQFPPHSVDVFPTWKLWHFVGDKVHPLWPLVQLSGIRDGVYIKGAGRVLRSMFACVLFQAVPGRVIFHPCCAFLGSLSNNAWPFPIPFYHPREQSWDLCNGGVLFCGNNNLISICVGGQIIHYGLGAQWQDQGGPQLNSCMINKLLHFFMVGEKGCGGNNQFRLRMISPRVFSSL